MRRLGSTNSLLHVGNGFSMKDHDLYLYGSQSMT